MMQGFVEKADTKSVRSWWDQHPFAFGVSNKNRDQVGTIPLERMNRAYFDEVERRFRKHHRFAAQADKAPLLSNLINYSKIRGKRVLDIATGSGFLAVQFAKAGAQVTAIDLTPFAVEHARKNFAVRNVPGVVLEADAQQLPFEDQSFDIVMAWGCLMHMPDTERAIREIQRVLRPGGQAVAYMYNKNSWPFWFNIIFLRGVLLGGLVRYRFDVTKLTSRYSDGYSLGGNPLTKFYSPNDVRGMFREAGFAEVTAKPWVLPEEPNSWPLRSLPLGKYLPMFIKRRIAYFGYGLIVTART
jgi:ubiquinone/menaquinone biosynthesis C-methylase UbiE